MRREGAARLALGSVAGSRRWTICGSSVRMRTRPVTAKDSLLPPNDAALELAIDEDLPETVHPPTFPGGWILLAVGVLATVLLLRIGWNFFFLPIILPFGFGGGSLIKRAVRRLRPRVLQFYRGVLSLVTVGPFGPSRLGAIDVSPSVFVSLDPTGTWVNGEEQVRLRIVSGDGALVVPLANAEHARFVRRELTSLLDDARVPIAEPEETLKGAVFVRDIDGGVQLEWSTSHPRVGASIAGLFLIAVVVFGLLLVFVLHELSEPLLVGLIVVGLLPAIFVSFIFPSGMRKTSLLLQHDAWALHLLSGGRVAASTGGPGPLSARVVRTSGIDPTGMGMAVRGQALELQSDGETVATIGDDLSEPELHFLAERIRIESR